MLVHLMSHFALLETVAAPLAIRNSSELGGRRGVWHQHSSADGTAAQSLL